MFLPRGVPDHKVWSEFGKRQDVLWDAYMEREGGGMSEIDVSLHSYHFIPQ